MRVNNRVYLNRCELFIDGAIYRLSLSKEVRDYAYDLLKREIFEINQAPKSIVAALIYVATLIKGEKISQRDVAEALGIHEVTLRTHYKEVISKLTEEDFPEIMESGEEYNE